MYRKDILRVTHPWFFAKDLMTRRLHGETLRGQGFCFYFFLCLMLVRFSNVFRHHN